MNIINNTTYKSYLLEEKLYRKKIDKYEKYKTENMSKTTLYKSKIDDYTQRLREINFDIECIEDPISRPLGTGQENRRVEILIRELESEGKRLESKIHWFQSQIIRSMILIDQYQSKIKQDRETLISVTNKINKFTRNALNQNKHYEKVQKIEFN